MIACVTSIGEPTTDLCKWALERNGFDVVMYEYKSTFWQKLKDIYDNTDEPFLRVDADIIVNRNLTPELLIRLSENPIIWWWQFVTFDWYKQDLNHSMAFIKKEALPYLRLNIGGYTYSLRPETDMSRLNEFHNPRRMKTYDDKIMGIHGYGIKDMKPVIKTKANRGQTQLYDFELAQRLNEL